MLVHIMNTTSFLQPFQFVILGLCLNFRIYFFLEQIVCSLVHLLDGVSVILSVTFGVGFFCILSIY